MLRTIGKYLLIFTCSFPLTAAQEAPTTQALPSDPKGEEVFGPGYLPNIPAADAVPLEPGRPAAGLDLSAFVTPGTLDALSARFGEDKASPQDKSLLRNVPLLRSFRQGNALPQLRLRRLEDEAKPVAPTQGAVLKVHFVNVGQGAGAILEFPCHTAVIDTGGEYAKGPNTVKGGELFEAYLDRYFRDRPERKRVIDVLFTSHPHEDHLAGLRSIMSRTGESAYTIRNVVDNGQSYDKGSLQAQLDFETWAKDRGARYSAITVNATRSATGVTNAVIDPIGSCKGVDPIITGLWGANYAKIKANAKPTDPWVNPNNHSLVLRIDFGKASFLFVGDLEDTGSNEMLREFAANSDVFNVDVYAVSHHGAGDDTTDPFVKAMSPRIGIISMGTPLAKVQHSAWAYGHPRLKAIDVMQKQPEIVTDTRPARPFDVASAVSKFSSVPIGRAIYGTGWEGSLIVEASTQAQYRVIAMH